MQQCTLMDSVEYRAEFLSHGPRTPKTDRSASARRNDPRVSVVFFFDHRRARCTLVIQFKRAYLLYRIMSRFGWFFFFSRSINHRLRRRRRLRLRRGGRKLNFNNPLVFRSLGTSSAVVYSAVPIIKHLRGKKQQQKKKR